ncbi:MAG: HupE/UreJ family protein [Methylibium sp.]|uniref:HupE/UreJ family protein n=1 Tax=Methylibium sp. TaxID=2067992 RepID=UPI0017CFDE85|nr:HupE/UreJ family protein [Methylibium sp.]MBA3598741.1 HupE/UreJ family protein [Methylibium sp.]
MPAWRARCAALLALLAAAPAALAHQASDAYLRAAADDKGQLVFQADVALRDLDVALALDADADGRLSWGEVRRREAEIADHVAAHLQLEPARCALQRDAAQPLALDRKADGVYAVLHFTSDCAAASAPSLAYGLFRDIDPTHRGLLQVLGPDGQPIARLRSLAPGGAPVRLARAPNTGSGAAGVPDPTAEQARSAPGARPAEEPAALAVANVRSIPDLSAADAPASSGARPADEAPTGGFFGEGLHHILIGADHVLFLICLLLPLALGRDAQGGVARGRALWLPLVALVTAFTVAHSITLGLAAWRVLAVPPSVIEPLIALTIAIAAADNLWPVLGRRRVLAAFAFGLIHGFGFAGPLIELDLPPLTMAGALLLFNLGVEAGQLMVVALAVLVLAPLRGRPAAQGWMRGGSIAAGLLALVWLGERLLDVKVLPV